MKIIFMESSNVTESRRISWDNKNKLYFKQQFSLLLIISNFYFYSSFSFFPEKRNISKSSSRGSKEVHNHFSPIKLFIVFAMWKILFFNIFMTECKLLWGRDGKLFEQQVDKKYFIKFRFTFSNGGSLLFFSKSFDRLFITLFIPFD